MSLDAPILSQGTNQARHGSKHRCVKLTARTRRRSGHPHRCVAFHADIARAAWWPRTQAGQREDNPDINAHQSNPAAALPTNSSLTDGIYFGDLVAQAPERKPVPFSPRHCRDVAHAQTGLAQTRWFLFLFQPAAPPAALSAAFPASVISYSMSCMLGDCDERLM